MQKLIWSKEACEKFTSGSFTISYVMGEVKELWEEVKKFNLEEASKEWDDVIACGSIWVSCNSGVNIPLFSGFGLGAVKRWEARQQVWTSIFRAHGLVFDKRYLSGGSNYKKKKKWVLALKEAGYQGEINYDLELVDWEWEV